ncbi:uncharacterized protein LOC132302353 [Cornus florida]|uniref:uncharacterized protein LOC132302353 n=1 Tax=Cornus florida TaxID=4283 RepID=UPI0028A1B12B|nr:uncharacterized protein LOC132302353 [Cornus florida]
MASSRSLNTATALMKILPSQLSPQTASPLPTRSLFSVALPTSAGSEANSGLTAAVDPTNPLRSRLSPQMSVTRFAARSFHTVGRAKSDSLPTTIGLTKLLRSPPTVTPFAARSLCTVPVRKIVDSESDADLGSIDLEGVGDRKGCSKAFEKKLVHDRFYLIRLNLPGVTSDDLKIMVDEKKDIVLEGKCKSEAKYGYGGSVYNGRIPGCPLLCKMDQLETEMIDGVLWITLPLTEDARRAFKWQRDLLVKKELSFDIDAIRPVLTDMFLRDPNNKIKHEF